VDVRVWPDSTRCWCSGLASSSPGPGPAGEGRRRRPMVQGRAPIGMATPARPATVRGVNRTDENSAAGARAPGVVAVSLHLQGSGTCTSAEALRRQAEREAVEDAGDVAVVVIDHADARRGRVSRRAPTV